MKPFTIALVLAVVAASPASATTTYFYGGHINPTNSRDGGIVAYVDLHAAMTFEFSVAAPLASNLVNAAITASVLSWKASAGQPTSTITNTDPNALLTRLRLSTDATGVITNWNIVASATQPALGYRTIAGKQYGKSPNFYFENDGGGYSESVRFIENAYGQNTGGATCCGGGASPGSFVIEPPPVVIVPGVPEPSTWALFIAGMGMIGAAMRRRRQAVRPVAV